MPGAVFLVLVLLAVLQCLLVVKLADKLTDRATTTRHSGQGDIQSAGRFAQSA